MLSTLLSRTPSEGLLLGTESARNNSLETANVEGDLQEGSEHSQRKEKKETKRKKKASTTTSNDSDAQHQLGL
jgi:hypothetical protein